MGGSTVTDLDLEEVVRDSVNAALAYRSTEGAARVRLTMDDIPEELVREAGLDLFPPELQDEILQVTAHVTDFVLEEMSKADREGPPQGFLSRAWDCYQRMPSKDIWRDHQRNVFGTHRPPGGLGRLSPYVAPAVSIGTTFGSGAGWMYGCLTNPVPRMGRR